MRIDLIDDSLLKLNSPHIAVRNEALNHLHNIRDIDEVNYFFKIAKESEHDDYIYNIIINCENNLKVIDVDRSKLCVYILFFFHHRKAGRIRELARKVLQNFFRNTDINDPLKAHCLRFAWRELDNQSRRLVIKFMVDFKYDELSYLLLDVFQYDDIKVFKATLDALIFFKETRANRFLRVKLQTELQDTDLLADIISAIGKLGSFIDYQMVKSFIKHSDDKVIAATLMALPNLSLPRSLKDLAKLFPNLKSEHKKNMLHAVSNTNSIESLLFLLNLLQKNYQNDLNLIQWAIFNISVRKKVKTIIHYYHHAQDNIFKYHLLNILADFHDDRCSKLYQHIIEHENNKLFRIVAIESLGTYDDFKAKNTLENIFLSHTEFSLSAFQGLLKSSLSSMLSALSRYFETPEIHTVAHDQLALSYLRNESTINIQHAINYISEKIQSPNLEIKLMAIDAVKVHHNSETVSTLLQLTKTENHIVQDSARNILHAVINHFPYYISPKNLSAEMLETIACIDYFKADYKLILHTVNIYEMAKSLKLKKVLNKNLKILEIRLNTILENQTITQHDQINLIYFMLMNSMGLSPANSQLVIKELYPLLEDQVKQLFLRQILESQNSKPFHFVTDEIFHLGLHDVFREEYRAYLESVL